MKNYFFFFLILLSFTTLAQPNNKRCDPPSVLVSVGEIAQNPNVMMWCKQNNAIIGEGKNAKCCLNKKELGNGGGQKRCDPPSVFVPFGELINNPKAILWCKQNNAIVGEGKDAKCCMNKKELGNGGGQKRCDPPSVLVPFGELINNPKAILWCKQNNAIVGEGKDAKCCMNKKVFH